LIYLDKTDTYQKWSFQKIDSFQSLDVNTILNITGSQQDVIFCEGNSFSSVDCKILTALYPSFSIMPVNSCEQVINNTRGLNGQSNVFRRKAFGIVDRDFRIDKEVTSLNDDSIAVLGYSEWENILLCKSVLGTVNSGLLNKDMDNLISECLKTIASRKAVLLNDFLNKRYLRLIATVKFKYTESLCEDIEKQNIVNKAKLMSEVNALSNDFDKHIRENNYDELIRIIPGKCIIGDAVNLLGIKSKDDYVDKVVALISSDKNFANQIRAVLGVDSVIMN
jgi:hypothetical protein